MSLTYEIVEDGYYLIKDGNRWMYQPSNIIPYPGGTIEESAQNHINAIIADNEAQPSTPSLENEIESLKQSQSEQDSLIMQLILGGMQ